MKEDDRRKEIDDYLDRCAKLTPEERLAKLGEMRDFFLNHMTPEGRRFFQSERLKDIE